MKITGSQIGLSSASAQSVSRSNTTRVRAWTDEGAVALELSSQSASSKSLQAGSGSISLPARTALRMRLPSAPPPPPPRKAKDAPATEAGKPKAGDDASETAVASFLSSKEGADLMLLKAILEQTTGRKFTLAAGVDYELSESDQARIDELSAAASQQLASTAPAPNAAPTRVGWGLEIQSEARSVEHSETNVAASGTLLTQDGRQIQFDAKFSYASDRVSVERFELRAGDAKLKDPLMLVFDGTTPELGKSIDFDLDADGKAERMAFASNNARLLVYDRNANGKVDDGRELFGALSGSGFADLAKLDDDGNGFIDEGDRAFSQLYTWESRTGEADTLVSLKDRGVGALYTGSVQSPFELRASDGELRGRIAETGLYFDEDGDVHALQHVDVKVTELPPKAEAQAAPGNVTPENNPLLTALENQRVTLAAAAPSSSEPSR